MSHGDVAVEIHRTQSMVLKLQTQHSRAQTTQDRAGHQEGDDCWPRRQAWSLHQPGVPTSSQGAGHTNDHWKLGGQSDPALGLSDSFLELQRPLTQLLTKLANILTQHPGCWLRRLQAAEKTRHKAISDFHPSLALQLNSTGKGVTGAGGERTHWAKFSEIWFLQI